MEQYKNETYEKDIERDKRVDARMDKWFNPMKKVPKYELLEGFNDSNEEYKGEEE